MQDNMMKLMRKRDVYNNPEGNEYDLGIDGAFSDFKNHNYLYIS